MGLSPRVRGNLGGMTGEEMGADPGLSPRVRGNRIEPTNIALVKIVRSIPACAGEPNPRGPSAKGTVRRSIPACAGEPHHLPEMAANHSSGSIPACAGEPALPAFAFTVFGRSRSIPACAGEPIPDQLLLMSISARVYPRVCGGTSSLQEPRHRTCDDGLSPRVRGNPQTFAGRSITNRTGVYPRVCGGTLWAQGQFGRHATRSIPACAGEPIRAARD